MMHSLRGFAVAVVVLAICDAVWLGFISREFYKARLGSLLLDTPIWAAAILFYLIHAAGIVIFPARLAAGDLVMAVLYGGLFGLCVYAAYDLSNLATLRGWSVGLTIVDLVWGTALTAVTTAVVSYFSR
jgi:uncharacterized membrane protein